MKDDAALFVELSLQQCKQDDYGNRAKVRKHNAAWKKLLKLEEKMRQNGDEDTLHRLLEHEDERVKANAAAFCLQSRILVDKSVAILKELRDTSNDWTVAFSAKMLLRKEEDSAKEAP